MGDENPIRTLEDYSKPSHEGYRNTIELPVGNNVHDPITTWRIFTTHFLSSILSSGKEPANFAYDYPDVPTTSGESLSEAWTSFKDLLQKSSPHHGIDLGSNLVPDTQYCMEDPKHSPLLNKHFLAYDEVGGLVSNFITSQDARLSKFEDNFKQQQSEMTNKIDTVLKVITDRIAGALPSDTVSCPVNIIPLYLFKKLNIGLLEETDHIFGLADGTKFYPVGIVKDVEVHIGKLKLLNDFYVIDMKKDPKTPLLVGRGFLAYCNVDCHLPEEWEIARDVELNPFKDTLVFRRMVIFDEKKLESS
ncbi:MAK10-like protein [Tanacetum coccineum]